MKLKKEYRKIVEPLLAEGWRLCLGGSGHARLFPPSTDHPPITFALTPGEYRGLQNFKACRLYPSDAADDS